MQSEDRQGRTVLLATQEDNVRATKQTYEIRTVADFLRVTLGRRRDARQLEVEM